MSNLLVFHSGSGSQPDRQGTPQDPHVGVNDSTNEIFIQIMLTLYYGYAAPDLEDVPSHRRREAVLDANRDQGGV